MSFQLKMFQEHDPHKVADMQRVGRRIKTDISGSHLFVQLFLRPGHDIMDHPPPA